MFIAIVFFTAVIKASENEELIEKKISFLDLNVVSDNKLCFPSENSFENKCYEFDNDKWSWWKAKEKPPTIKITAAVSAQKSIWDSEAVIGTAAPNVCAANKDHLPEYVKNDFGEDVPHVCVKFTTFYPRLQSVEAFLTATVTEMEFQKDVAKQADYFGQCISVPVISENIFVVESHYQSKKYNLETKSFEPVQTKSIQALRFMEQVEVFAGEPELKDQAERAELKEFLENESEKCGEKLFYFLQHIQEQGLYPIDIKIWNVGIVRDNGKMSKLSMFDLGDNHNLTFNSTVTPQHFNEQVPFVGNSLNSLERLALLKVHEGDKTNGVNPAFFETYIFLFYAHDHHVGYPVPEDLCKKVHEIVIADSADAWKNIFQLFSQKFDSMKGHYASYFNQYACSDECFLKKESLSCHAKAVVLQK